MKKMFKAHKEAKNFELNIVDKDMMLLALIAAAKGITPEMLLECFVSDIVSYFSSEEVSKEEDFLSRWFMGSWFSQDDGYFSFLHYLICTERYRYVINALNELRECRLKELKNKSDELNKQEIKFLKISVKRLFGRYCADNPAHKPLADEIRVVRDFERKYRLSDKLDYDEIEDWIDVVNCRGAGNESDNNIADITAVQ